MFLVLLLGLDEGLLEKVGLWQNALAAASSAGGVGLTLGIGQANSKRLGLWLALAHVRHRIPNPASGTAYVGHKVHLRYDCDRVGTCAD